LNLDFFLLKTKQIKHYIDEGQGDPILCLHGNPTWSFYFRNVVKHFHTNYRVIVPDHMGCGLSSRPQNYSYTLENHIRNVEKLVLHLDLKNISLVVHDWGGPIGLGFALRHKDRIRKLVILNTAAFLSKDIPKRIASLRVFSDVLIRRANLFCLAATVMCTVKKLPSEIKKAYLHPYSNYHQRVAIEAFVKDIPLNANDTSYETLSNIEKSLPSLNKPTLILWFFEQWKKVFPSARALSYEQAGHYVLEDETEKVLKEIETFLREKL
jgi:haloalkane dehalogenase